jgi:hypothetical protein
MIRTTRIARIALAAGLVAGVLAPAGTALALTPPAPNSPSEFAIPEPTDPTPNPGDKLGPGPTGPECNKIVCLDDFGPGDKTPGDNPGDKTPGDEPGDQPGDNPGNGGSGDSSDVEVESDTVVATPNFTG